MKKPKVSVCIPVYGTEKVLRKCLDSVAMQDFAEKEIVVVSDASCGVNENRKEVCQGNKSSGCVQGAFEQPWNS